MYMYNTLCSAAGWSQDDAPHSWMFRVHGYNAIPWINRRFHRGRPSVPSRRNGWGAKSMKWGRNFFFSSGVEFIIRRRGREKRICPKPQPLSMLQYPPPPRTGMNCHFNQVCNKTAHKVSTNPTDLSME